MNNIFVCTTNYFGKINRYKYDENKSVGISVGRFCNEKSKK